MSVVLSLPVHDVFVTAALGSGYTLLPRAKA